MQNPTVVFEPLHIVGIKTRTSNAGEAAGAGKIQALWNTFFADGISAKIEGKLDSKIFAVYHDYESDADAPYTLLIGLKVPPGTKPPAGLELITIPQQSYAQFTTRKGPMPDIVIEAWKSIWSRTQEGDLARTYTYDFETYDHRAADPKSSEVDIFIAIT